MPGESGRMSLTERTGREDLTRGEPCVCDLEKKKAVKSSDTEVVYVCVTDKLTD